MSQSILHRGPDSSGIWIEEGARVAFAHNRLAILDLSLAGNQPMASASGRFVIIYNGEIYNHQDIRDELTEAGRVQNWRGHSDTETLLEAIEAWGIRGAVDRSAGMFAFALWDRAERTLSLGRDRLGEKPLYYGRQFPGGPFLFGSELKALREHPQFRAEVDRQALMQFLRYNYVPAPFSIYEGINKLPAGTLLTLRDGCDAPVVDAYWSAAAVAEAGVSNPLSLSDEDAIDELQRRLERSIGGQMMADVPVGAFLSGGIDSSTIVALMQKQASRPIKTFTVGFHESGFNEAEHARAVAGHLGTDHTELYVTPAETLAVIPKLAAMYDEPFGDSSQIPTHLISALAREQVTVSLSGDGGDELFCGYNRYLMTSQLWGKISPIPQHLRAAAARIATVVPPSAWTRFGEAARPILPKLFAADCLGDKVHKGAPLLRSASDGALYEQMVTLWRNPDALVIGATGIYVDPSGTMQPGEKVAGLERMMLLDTVRYLPDDILVKVDRAAMAVSLETRVPFLDHRVVEFAWSLPLGQKIRGDQTKWILRQLLCRLVPKELIERPKMGFGVPVGEWLRGPLRDWAETLLDERRLRNEGYFRPGPIRQMWQAHLDGRMDEQFRLWGLLMFQSWLEVGGAGAVGMDRRSVSVASAIN